MGVALIAAALLVPASASSGAPTAVPAGVAVQPPPINAQFDYQIGGDYSLPDGVGIVSRDWFIGSAAADPVYSICYVNGFQTQPNESGTDRPDEKSNWPRKLVLSKLGDDPNWGGEYLVDIRNANKRERAARWLQPMIEICAEKGFAAVEFDNLDSWTRFNGTPLARKVPFGKHDAVKFARELTRRSHRLGLAVAQKNTTQIKKMQAGRIGFDFALVEDCARYNECNVYRKTYGNRMISIEYRRPLFERACEQIGDEVSVVLRDRGVRRPTSKRYLYDAC